MSAHATPSGTRTAAFVSSHSVAPSWVQKRFDKSLAQRLALLERTYGALPETSGRARDFANLGLAAYLGSLRLLRTSASVLSDDDGIRSYLEQAAATLIPG